MLGVSALAIVGSIFFIAKEKLQADKEKNVSIVKETPATPVVSDKTTPPNNETKKNTTHPKVSLENKTVLKEFAALAHQGKLRGIADIFTVGKTTITQVHKQWGQPNEKSQAPYESYYPGMMKGTYEFGVGHADVIFEIRHFDIKDPAVQQEGKIKRFEIIAVLGKPKRITHNGSDEILTYSAGQYDLKFVVPTTTGKIDHVDLVSPNVAKK